MATHKRKASDQATSADGPVSGDYVPATAPDGGDRQDASSSEPWFTAMITELVQELQQSAEEQLKPRSPISCL